MVYLGKKSQRILPMFNHPEIKFLQSEFQCLHLSACVHIFSHCMTSYNFEANAIVRIVDI
jgi:hypothetical protein